MACNRRVVITGLGIVSPFGVGAKVYWENLRAGRSSIAPVSAFDTSAYRSHIAAEVRDFHVADFLGQEMADKWTQGHDRANQFLLLSLTEAVKEARLEPISSQERISLSIGSAVGDFESRALVVDDLFACAASGDEAGFERQAERVFQTFVGAIGLKAARFLGTGGDSTVISTACASSTDAVVYGFRQVQQGDADVVIAGGTEAPIWPILFYSYSLLDVVSPYNDDPPRASRPFDRTRGGFVIAEGGGAIVLEEFEHARRRGAHIYAEVAGANMTADAYHMTAPNPSTEQLSRAIRGALKEAGVAPSAVDYVCAHGTSTLLNDVNETNTLKNVFGTAAYSIPVSSIKSMLGHPQGASGIMQAVTCALVMENGFVPPTINYSEPDPECDLDYVPNVGRDADVQVILQDTLSFYGRNSVLLYRKVQDAGSTD